METVILKGEKAILEGARLIQSGDVVVFPTETVYGLGANAFDEDKRAAIKCGMNGFISKPIVLDEVVEALKDVFDN